MIRYAGIDPATQHWLVGAASVHRYRPGNGATLLPLQDRPGQQGRSRTRTRCDGRQFSAETLASPPERPSANSSSSGSQSPQPDDRQRRFAKPIRCSTVNFTRTSTLYSSPTSPRRTSTPCTRAFLDRGGISGQPLKAGTVQRVHVVLRAALAQPTLRNGKAMGSATVVADSNQTKLCAYLFGDSARWSGPQRD